MSLTHSNTNPAANTEHSLWADAFLRDTLAHWLAASAEPSGLFYPFLDRQWRRTPPGPLSLVSQCRLIYNFSRACETWPADTSQAAQYQDAVHRGIDALRRCFALPSGGWRWSVTPDGAPHDDTPDAYGHAFVVLSLATAGRVFAVPAWTEQAGQAWQFVQTVLRDPAGGLLWKHRSAESFALSPRSQNPLMHSFEALMALHAARPNGDALDAARGVLAFVSGLSGFGTGALIEDYNAQWQPLPISEGGVVNIGHQWEWAWLLSEWHRLTGDDAMLAAGRRFLRTAAEWGLETDGATRTACAPDGTVVDSTHGLWPQCEAVRALHRYIARHGADEYTDALHQAVQFYRTAFADTEYGGALAGPAPAVSAAAQIKGDAWKLDYHTLGMCLELMSAAPGA